LVLIPSIFPAERACAELVAARYYLFRENILCADK
jgi:hypothetical protein